MGRAVDLSNSFKSKCTAMVLERYETNRFTVVMGIGIMSILVYTCPIPFIFQKYLGIALFILTLLEFSMTMIIWITKWIIMPKQCLKEFSNPSKLLFYGALAMAINIIGNAFLIIGGQIIAQSLAIAISKVLWVVGVLIGLFCVIAVPYLLFTKHKIDNNEVLASWLIPVVPPIVAAAIGANLIPFWENENTRMVITIIALALAGMSLFLFIMVSGVFYSRLIYGVEMKTATLPSVWIEMGPIGMTMALFSTLPLVTQDIFPLWSVAFQPLGFVMAALMWGIGLWWAVISSLFSLVRIFGKKKEKIPFSIGWWGYIFPLGSFTNGTFAINKLLGGNVFFVRAGAIQFAILTILFIIVLIKTLSKDSAIYHLIKCQFRTAAGAPCNYIVENHDNKQNE